MFNYYWFIVYFTLNYKLKNFNNLNLNLNCIKIYSLYLDSNIYNINLVRMYAIMHYISHQYPKLYIGFFYKNNLKFQYLKLCVSLRKTKLLKFLKLFLSNLIYYIKKNNLNLIKKKVIKSNYTFYIKNIMNFFFLPAEYYNLNSNLIIIFEFKKNSNYINNLFLNSMNLH